MTLHLRRNLRRNLTNYYARRDTIISEYSFRGNNEEFSGSEQLGGHGYDMILENFCQRLTPLVEEVHQKEMALIFLRTRLLARSKGNWKRYRKAAKLLRLEDWPRYGEVDRKRLTLDFLVYARSILRMDSSEEMEDYGMVERSFLRSRLTSSLPKGFWDLKHKLYIRSMEDLRLEELRRLELYNNALEEELANFEEEEEEEEWVPRDDYSDEEEEIPPERKIPKETVKEGNFVDQDFGKAKWTPCLWTRAGIPIRYELEWPPPSLQTVARDEENDRIETPKPEVTDVQLVKWKITMKKYPFLDGNFIKRSVYVMRNLTVDPDSPDFLDSQIPREILLGGLAGGKSYDMDHRLKARVDLGEWKANDTVVKKKEDAADQRDMVEGDLGTKEMNFLMTWKISSKPLPKLLGRKDEQTYETVHEHKLDLLCTRRSQPKEKKPKKDPLPEPPKPQPTSDELKYWTVTPCMDWGGKKHNEAASNLHNIKAKTESLADSTQKSTDRADESTTSADPYPWKLSRPKPKDFNSHWKSEYDTIDGKPSATKSECSGPNEDNQDQKMGGRFYADSEPLDGGLIGDVENNRKKEEEEEQEEEQQQRKDRILKRIKFPKFSNSRLTDIDKATNTDTLNPPAGTTRANPRPTLVDPTYFEFDGWQEPEKPALLRARQSSNSRVLGPEISEDSRALPRHNGFDDFDFSTAPLKPPSTEPVIPTDLELQVIYSKPTIAITSQCSTELKDKQRDQWMRLLRRLETCTVGQITLVESQEEPLFAARWTGNSGRIQIGGKEIDEKEVQLKLEATIVDPNPEPGLWGKEPKGPQKAEAQKCLLLTCWSVILPESKTGGYVEANNRDYSFTDLTPPDPTSKDLRINKTTGTSTRLLAHSTYFDPRSRVVLPEFTTPSGLEKWYTQYLDGYKDLGTGIWDPDTWSKPDIELETFPYESWSLPPIVSPSSSKEKGPEDLTNFTALSKLLFPSTQRSEARPQSTRRIKCHFLPLSPTPFPLPVTKAPDTPPLYQREVIFEPYVFTDLTNPRSAPSGLYFDLKPPET